MENDERHNIIIYINNNIDKLDYTHRKYVLQMIYNDIGADFLIEKGSETQIKYKNINNKLLENIYNYIKTNIEVNI
jgi:hypothetical protein